jgi:hypothetical protein
MIPVISVSVPEGIGDICKCQKLPKGLEGSRILWGVSEGPSLAVSPSPWGARHMGGGRPTPLE